MSSTWVDPYAINGPPRFQPITDVDPPPYAKDGRRLFEGEKFHIIPNEKEKERMGEGKGLDLIGPLEEFITERAGGTLVSIEEATFILIRHPHIHSFAQSIADTLIAKKIIHFDWVMNSICARFIQGREDYWGIPRPKENPSFNHKQSVYPGLNIQLPQDPRKRVVSSSSTSSGIRSLSMSSDHAKYNQSQYLPSPLSSSSPYIISTPPSSSSSYSVPPTIPFAKPPPPRRVSECNQPRSDRMSNSKQRRVTFDFSHQGLPENPFQIFKGDNFYVVGPMNARITIESKITQGGGEISPNFENSTKLILVNPRVVQDKSRFFSCLKKAISQRKSVLTEAWIHDGHSSRIKPKESLYKVTLEDLETRECWLRSEKGKLLVSDVDSKLNSSIKKEDLQDQRVIASRAYGTPESPERTPLVVEAAKTGYEIVDMAYQRNLIPERKVSCPVNNQKRATANRFRKESKEAGRLIIEDEDLDICCTNSEEEELDNPQGLETCDKSKSDGRIILKIKRPHISESASSSPLTSPSELEEEDDLISINKESEKSNAAESIQVKKRKLNIKTPLDQTPKRRKSQFDRESTIRPSDQNTFDRLILILKNMFKEGGPGMPKGGMRAYVRRNKLETIYRRYEDQVRNAVPGLPKGRNPHDSSGKFTTF